MAAKQISPLPIKRRAAPVSSRTVRANAAPVRVPPVFELSFDVEPVVSVIRRHVKLSKAADAAITHDLIEMLGRAIVLLRTTENKAAADSEDPQLTTEQAAQLAGVSRPYMAKLIDTGVVTLHQMVGKQRRVLRSALMRWQEAKRARQTKALKRLAQDLDEDIFSS